MATLTSVVRTFGRATRRSQIVALLTLLCVPMAAPAIAETATAPAMKAAFLYNFAKFIEWPADALPANAPLVLCVAGDSRVQKALEESTRGREVDGHPLVVRKMDRQGALDSCHLLYADSLDAKRAALLIERLKGAPVFSVSDFDTFAELGGIAHLFIEDGRMRFAVNLNATRRTKLRPSSRLLSLAKIVKDDTNASEQ